MSHVQNKHIIVWKLLQYHVEMGGGCLNSHVGASLAFKNTLKRGRHENWSCCLRSNQGFFQRDIVE